MAAHSQLRGLYGQLSELILRHELTHAIFHNWRLQMIILSKRGEGDLLNFTQPYSVSLRGAQFNRPGRPTQEEGAGMREVVIGGVIGIVLVVGAASGWAEEGHDHGAHAHGASTSQEQHAHGGGEAVTIKGELVDSLCYVTMHATGAGHKQCAMDCAKAGIPISMLEDETGKLYTVLPAQDKTGYPESVIARMGETVTLRGDLYENGGMRYVTVESVE